MLAEPRHDRGALRWIRGELDQTLREARLALEGFVEGETQKIARCMELLHQVHGALEMAQIYGAAMLADEMEQLAQTLSLGNMHRVEPAAEALMTGMVQLPAYLEQIEAGGADIPLALLPLMNDLRAAREAPLISETSLFAPKLNARLAAEMVRPGSGNRALPHLVLRQRSHFHRGLLHLIRGQDLSQALQQIRNVLDNFHVAAGTERLRRLLGAADALAAALMDQDQEPPLATKLLFGRLDRVFKQIIDQGEEPAMLDFPVDLLKNLLYYVARSDSQSPAVSAVRRREDLAEAFPEQAMRTIGIGSLGAPDRTLFAAVGEALKPDLDAVKDQLDLFIRSDRSQLDKIGGLAQPVQRIADTLGMVGRGDLRARLKHRCDELTEVIQTRQAPSDERLMQLAEDLLLVESSLSSLAAGADTEEVLEAPMEGGFSQTLAWGELQQYMQAAIEEVMVELAQTKEAFLVYLADPGQPETLDSISPRMHLAAGALQILDMAEAADLLDQLQRYVEQLADGRLPVPELAEREAYADVLVCVELYMQSALEPEGRQARLLDYAAGALARLGQGDASPQGGDAHDAPSDLQGSAVTTPQPRETEAAQPTDADFRPEAFPPAQAELSRAPAAPESRSSQQDSVTEAEVADPALGFDAEILEVFSEEADEVLAEVRQLYPRWRKDAHDQSALQELRRAFHTLKGSGRIVGAANIGEFSWAVENLLNRVIDASRPMDAALFGLMDEVFAVLPDLVAESREPWQQGTDVSALSARAFELATQTPAQAPGDPLASAAVVGVAQETTLETGGAESIPESSQAAESLGSSDNAQSLDLDSIQIDESILTLDDAVDSVSVEVLSSGANTADSTLNALFLNEARGYIDVLGDFVERCAQRSDDMPFEEPLRRAMHTLRGSSRTAGYAPMAELAGALEDMTSYLHAAHRTCGGAARELLTRSHATLVALATWFESPQGEMPSWEPLRNAVATHMHDGLSAHAEMRDIAATGTIEPPDPELLEIFLDEAKELIEALEVQLADWESAVDDRKLVATLQRNLHTMKGGARLAGITPVADLSHALESVFEAVAERRIDGGQRLIGLVRYSTDALAQDVEQLLVGDLPVPHPELTGRLEAAAHGQDWDDLDEGRYATDTRLLPEGLEIAEGAADGPESVLLDQGDDPIAASLQEQVSRLTDESAYDSEILTDSQMLTDSELLGDSSYLVCETLEGGAGDTGLDVVQFPSDPLSPEAEGYVTRRPLPERRAAATGGTERVRVASNVLDQMVNNAGEVSIYRARIEQQNSSVAFHLGELQQTTSRLRSQLRDLEMETEAQMRSRHLRDEETRVDFDPLEMDRYSTIQQLSRALSETVEDLSNLGQSLSDLSRDTDTLLLQQARVTTDLQDSLLRTRMVKFASRVPRLERVVRQTCHSVAKQANLSVIGGEQDMDRAILERMMGPFEHLLRNAVSHGIEDAQGRQAAGKQAQGLITLQLSRDGTDVVLILADDGAGMDRDRIRAKAVERGLIDADARIDDGDLYQLVLLPGFSTAEELSQVSGRGVGMDVVLTEIKQLGGSLEIDSQPGVGTSFTIRLPFTLAITDALLVAVGEDFYAVPHNSMDGVVRIPVEDLRAIYAGQQEAFSYDGRSYTVRYLGTMLGSGAPHLVEGARWLPLLLVRSGEHRVAIHVDAVMGNRQIVVKSIGAQLSKVRWFTGGTILADGQIALILDTGSLVRIDSTQQGAVTELLSSAPATRGVAVMVVDDSITVRKVTSRLLERHNMQVVTAKDGVDAVTLLQDNHPDVMLLDIEMPRMDGYELARHMRSTPELRHIPIIMITSRTGDKHRNRAMELGVRRYLGKPYQEADLLENIYTVLADTAL